MCLPIYIIEVIVPGEDDDITAPDPKKRKLDVQLAGWFTSYTKMLACHTYKHDFLSTIR